MSRRRINYSVRRLGDGVRIDLTAEIGEPPIGIEEAEQLLRPLWQRLPIGHYVIDLNIKEVTS